MTWNKNAYLWAFHKVLWCVNCPKSRARNCVPEDKWARHGLDTAQVRWLLLRQMRTRFCIRHFGAATDCSRHSELTERTAAIFLSTIFRSTDFWPFSYPFQLILLQFQNFSLIKICDYLPKLFAPFFCQRVHVLSIFVL